MSILRVYDPRECDYQGVPLEWERCHRGCVATASGDPRDCPGGHMLCMGCYCYGSLKAAVLAELVEARHANAEIGRREDGYRCESCNHPMSEGTWEGAATAFRGVGDPQVGSVEWALEHLRQGHEPPPVVLDACAPVHYSPCDEGCRHGGPGREDGRAYDFAENPWQGADARPFGLAYMASSGVRVEASWRSVDIRTLGWPMDLRPERLAVLCLRCWAEREHGTTEVIHG